MFAYEEEQYSNNYTIEKVHGMGKKVKVIDLISSEIKEFANFSEAERYYNVPIKAFRGCAAAKRGEKEFVVKK